MGLRVINSLAWVGILFLPNNGGSIREVGGQGGGFFGGGVKTMRVGKAGRGVGDDERQVLVPPHLGRWAFRAETRDAEC